MRLNIITINGVDIALNPDECMVASALETQVAAGDVAGAAAAWREWLAKGYGVPGRKRRADVGNALNLAPKHDRRVDEDLREAAVANIRTLESCLMHRFDTEGITSWADAPERFKCIHCSGTMSALQAGAYAWGWRDHGGDPELVLPGFSR